MDGKYLTVPLTLHLTTFFIVNIPVALLRLRATLLQETSTAGLTLITPYFIDNLLLVLISLSYKAAPPVLAQPAITKEGAWYPCPEQYASWIERAFFTWGGNLMLRETIQYTGSLHPSRILHRKALDRILHSPIRLFDTAPLGRIINHFTRDMDTVDQQVTNVSANIMVDFLGNPTVTGVIAYVNSQFLVPDLVISALFVVIAMFYTRTSHELNRHEITTNSPVFLHFAEDLNGVTTIRAFGFEKRFNTYYQELLDEHNRP
ncbi:hypothetical protein KI688_008579 [Linnemannia hyalina]|uniref:ABC transmembrane type-1 domain-containing protein n=1 Tax=Linnemannia hyalina TaxID=64524 RepID=A0A9P8BXA0_9FUNG|nr:hypothetical protein KI688_008579 [Linnemannia hyalina]